MTYFNDETLSCNFSNLRRPESEIISAIYKIEGGFAGLSIIDIGCGTGVQLDFMTQYKPNSLIGVDDSLPMLRRAKKSSIKKFVNCDALCLPFKSSIFDIVTSIQSIHFIATHQLSNLFSSWKYVLKSGGRVYIATHSTEQIKSRFESRFFPSITSYDLKRFHSLHKLSILLMENGFSGLRIINVCSKPIKIDYTHLYRLKTGVLSFMRIISEEEIKIGLKKLKSCLGLSFIANWCILVAKKCN